MYNSTIQNLDKPVHKKYINLSLVVFLIIDISAVLMNVIFIKAIYAGKQRKHGRTHIYLIFVSVANLGVAVFVLPFTIVTLAAHRWIFGEMLCYVSGFMVLFWFMLTIYTMSILSVHNYYAIVWPMYRPSGRRISFRLLAAATVVSFIISAACMAYDKVTFEPALAQCTPLRVDGTRVIFTMVLCFSLCFVLPTCINGFACWKSLKTLSAGCDWLREHSTNYECAIRSKKHVTKTLYLAFAVYMFCWLPFFVLFIVYMAGVNEHILEMLRRAALGQGYLSSALNPLVYILRNRLYKKLYRRLSKKVSSLLKMKGRNPRSGEESESDVKANDSGNQ